MKIRTSVTRIQRIISRALRGSAAHSILLQRPVLAPAVVARHRASQRPVLRREGARGFSSFLALALVPGLFCASALQAAVKTSNGSGNWETVSWLPSAPVTGDDVIIRAGDSITNTATTLTINSLTFTNSSSNIASLQINAGVVLTVTAGVVLQNNASTNTAANLSGAGTLNCASMTVGGTVTGISGGARTTILTSTISNLAMTGNLAIVGVDSGSSDNNATFALNTGSVSVGGTVAFTVPSGSSATLSMTGGTQDGTLTLSGATPFSGGGTFSPNGTSATVIYSGGAQTVNAVAYRNLTVAGSGSKTIGSVTVNGTLSRQGTATLSAAPTYGAGAILEYKGSALQTSGAELAATVPNLTINNASGVNENSSVAVTGTLSLTAGALSIGANSLTLNNAISTTAGSLTGGASSVIVIGDAGSAPSTTLPAVTSGLQNLTLNRANGLTLGGALTVSGTLTLTTGSFSIGSNLTLGNGANISRANGSLSGTPNFGTSVNVTYTTGGVTTGSELPVATSVLQALNVNNGSGTVTLGANIQVNGTLTIASGATFADAGNTITARSTVSNSGTHSSTGSGEMLFAGTAAQSFAGTFGTVELANTAGTSISGIATVNGALKVTAGTFSVANTLTVNGATTVGSTLSITSTTGSKSFADLTVNGTFSNNSANEDVTITGSVANNGTFNAGSGLYTLSGTSKSFAGTISIPNVSLTGTYTNNGSLTVGTSLAGAGTLTQAAGASLTIGDSAINPTLAATAVPNTVNYNLGGVQTVKATTYHDLVLSGSGLKTMTGVTVNDLLSMQGTATSSVAPTYGANSTLEYRGSALQTTGAELAASLPSLTVSNASGVALASSPAVNGTLTLTSGALSIGANTLTINNAVSVGAGTLTGGASSAIVIGDAGSAASTTLPAVTSGLQNLTLNRANGAALGGAVTVSGTLTLTTGQLNNGANLTMANGATISRATGSLAAAPTFGTSVNLTYTGSTATTPANELPASTTVLNNLTVNNTGGVTLGGNLTVNGSLTLGSGSALDVSVNNYTVDVKLNWSNNGGTFTTRSGLVSFSGSGAQAINGTASSQTFNNLTVNKSGNTLSTGGSLATLNVTNLTQTAGGFTPPATLNVSGDFTHTAGTFTTAANFNLSGNWINNGAGFTAASGTVTLNGSGAQNIGGSTTTAFNNLALANTGTTVTADANFSVAGNMTVNANAVFEPVAAVIVSGSGTLTGSGTVRVTRTLATADFNSQYTIASKTLTNLTVEFSGSAAQIISALTTYGSVRINNANGVSLAGTTTIGGTLNLTNGTLSVGANTLNLNGPAIAGTPSSLITTSSSTLSFGGSSTGINIPGSVVALNGLTINNANGVALNSNPTISGTLTLTSGALSIGAHTLTLNGAISGGGSLTGGASANIVFGGAGSTSLPAVTLNDLTINRSGANITMGGAVTVGGTLTLTAGTFTVGGNTLTLNGPAIAGTSANLATTSSSSLVFGGTAGGLILPGGVSALNNLTIANTGAVVTMGTNLTVSGVCTINSGANLDASNKTLTLAGSGTTLVVNGSFTPSTSTVFYNNNSGASVAGIPYYNLTVAGNSLSDSFTLLGSITVSNVLTVGTAANATLNLAGFTVTLTAGGTPLVANGSLSGTSGATVAYTSTSGATVAGTTYTNLTINGTGTFALGASATVGGTLTLSSGILATGANQITVNNAANSAISGGGSLSYVNGTLQKLFGTAGNPQSFTFPVGDGTTYAPLALSAMSVTTAGNLRVKTTAGNHPQFGNDGLDSNKNVNRYWTLTNSPIGIAITTNTVVTFNYPATDVDSGATASLFTARRWNGTVWNTNIVSGTPTTTATSITGVNAFGDFDIGDQQVSSVVFTQQPATTNAGVTMAAVKVQPRDSLSVPIAGASVGLTLNSGTLNGTTNLTADGTGTATFSNLSINQAGTNKQFTATSDAISANSSNFAINAATGTKLTFTTQPTNTTAGATMAAVVVQVQDQFGNSVSSNDVPITVSVPDGFASGTLTRNTDATGKSIFNDLIIAKANVGDLMTATGSGIGAGLTNAVSTAFNVNAGVFAKLQLLAPGETAAPGTGSGKTGSPAAQTVSVPFNVAVNAVDANWNPINTNDVVGITSTDVTSILPPDAALVNGTNSFTVKLMTAGSSTVTASNLTHTSITANTSAAITVNKGNQTITFNPLADKTYGDAPFAVNATASSGLVVSFSMAAGAAGVVGNTVTLMGVGGVTVRASQAGDANWFPAPEVDQSFNVSQKLLVGSITADNKIYDGTNTATIAIRSLAGVVSPDSVSLVGGSATFDNRNVGSNKVVTATGLGLGGGDAIKYVLASANATNTANITTKGVTVSGITADNKVYDGTMAAVLQTGSASLVGTVSGDSLSLDTSAVAGLFADKNVGAGKTVTVSGLALTGGDSGNYSLTQPSTSADITAASLTGSVTVDSKVYDGTNTATIATRSLTGVISPDDVTLTGGSALFSDKMAANGKTVIATGLSLSGADVANYTLASTSATNTANITQRTLTVSAAGVNRSYTGTADAAVTLSDDRLSGDVLTATASAAFVDKNVADGKTVNVSNIQISGADSANYSLASTTTSTTANISPVTLTVTANNASRFYNTANPEFAASYGGFVTDEGQSELSGSPSLMTTATQASLVGTYPITAAVGTLSAQNYLFSFVDGSLTITANGILFADDFSRASDPESLVSPWIVHSGNWSVTGGTLLGGANVASSYGFAHVNASWTNYSVQANIQFPTTSAFGAGIGGHLNPANGSHYAAWVYPDNSPSSVGANKIALVKFRTWDLWGYTNGDYFPMVVADLPAVGTTAHLVKLTFDGSQITVSYDGAPMITTTDTEIAPSTSGGISVDLWTDNLVPYVLTVDNVLVTTPTAQTINFAALGDKTYGDAPFAVSATATSGLNVSFSVVSGPATINNDLVTVNGAGLVTIRASQAGNEVFTPAPDVDRSFTVNPAALTVVANNDTRIYGSANPTFTGALLGVVNSDDITATYASAADPTSTVGNYDIVPTLVDPGSRLANYTVASTNGVLTVTPAALSVTAASTSRIYGSSNPAFTGSVLGVLNNDGITASYTTAADANSVVGGYDIVPVLSDPNSALSNYFVASTNGTLTVTPAALSVTADSTSRTYGSANHAFTGSVLGVLNNDGITASYTTAADTNSAVGGYNIVPQLSDPNSRLANYTVASSNGTLTVTPAALLVIADDQSRAYGLTNPVFTVSYSGFVNGQNAGVLTGEAAVMTSADTNSPIGSYDIVASLGTLSNANYSFGFSNGTLTVTTAALLITADNQSRTYGAANPTLTVSYSGFVNGEGAGDLGGTPSVTTSADTNSPVGSYDIVVALGTLSNTNYSYSFSNATLTVSAASLSVTADSTSRIYGSANPAFTGSLVGVLNNDGITASYSTTADETSSVGNYDIVPSLNDPNNKLSNYLVASTNGVLTVTPAALSVTADSASRIYGSANPAFTGSLLGVLNNDGILAGYSTMADETSSVGNYDIIPSLLDPNSRLSNYIVASTNGVLSVTPAALSVTANNASRSYGDSNPIFSGSLLGILNNDGITASYSTAAGTNSLVGNYDIVPTLVDVNSRLGNYIVATTNGTLSVLPAALLVTADNHSRVFGATNPVLMVSYSGLVNGETPAVLSGAPDVTTSADTNSPIGSYDIVASLGTLSNANYSFGFSNGTLAVTTAALLITADNQSRTYGAANPTLTVSYSGFVNGESAGDLGGTPSVTTSADTNSPVGSYDIVVVLGSLSNTNYSYSFSNGTLTVSAASLSVTADNTSRIYGSANPALTGNLVGVLNNDGIAASYSTTADETSPVGNYDIVPSLSDPNSKLSNYNVASTNGVLTLTPAALSVTADSTSRIYGSANPVFTGNVFGVLNNDGIIASYSTTADETSSVGNYDIIPSLLDPNSRLSNYIVASTNGVLSVTPAALSVTANNASRSYGDANPILSGSLLGVLNSDGITASYSTVAGTNSPVGNYDIIPALIDVNNRLGNYIVSSTNGALSVLPAALLVTADNQSRAFGATNPVLMVSYSGFVNGETTAVLSGAPDVTTSADTNSPIGSYDIVASLGTLSNANYSFGFSNGTLTVTTAALLITADNQSRTYGAANPTLTVSYSGFVNGEGAGDLGGTPLVTTSADTNSPVGSYDIVVALGTLSNTNYSYSFSNATLSVSAASLSVTADSTSKVYGSANPAFTGNVVGLLNNDGITASYSTTADETSSVGNYDIVPSLSDPNNKLSNYLVASTNGVLTVTPAALSVTADSTSRIYGSANPAFTGSLLGVLNNDGILAGYSTMADETSSVGNYDIIPSILDPNSRLSNYILVSTNGVLSITPAALSVTANNASRGYGAANPIFSGSLLGVLNNDGITASYTTAADTNSPVGGYDIVPALNDPNTRLANYIVASTNGTLTVTPAALLVTADNQSRAFGATNPAFTASYSGFVNGETTAVLSGAPDVTTSADTNSPIGSYDIVASLGTLSNANYSFGFSNGTLTVTVAALVVSADSQSRVYGATNPVLTVSYSGFVNGEGAGNLGGTPSATTSAATNSPMGSYDIVVALGSLSNTNYSYSFSNATLSVTAASLSVTADSTSRTYGAANPILTGNLVGVLNNDGITANYTTTADANSVVGGYDIVPVLSDPNSRLSNYTVVSTNGSLTVTPAALSVTADSTSRIYGSANPAFTGNLLGVLNNDGILASYSTVADETSSVGNYDIVPSLSDPNSKLSNYIVASTNGVLSITPAALTLTANNASRGYGAANPSFGGSLLGVLNNDGIMASYSTVADTNSPVGGYDIVPVLSDPNTRLANYIVASTNGTLTVTPAALLVTAENQSRVFGATNPVLMVSYSGLVNGQNAGVLTGEAAVTTSADTNSPIGSYDIVASLGTLSNANYNFGFSNGTLTVTTAALLITADNQSRTYGAANPTLTVSYSGFVNGEGAGDLGGTPLVTTSADTNSPVGSYDIAVALGTLSNTNYSYSFSNATLMVSAASLSMTANSTSRIYGSANPTLTGNLVGVMNDDGITASYTTTADTNSPVGGYDIVPVLSDPNSRLSNYTVASTNGTLTVTPAALSVTADSTSRIYGSANPAFTGNLVGVLNNDGITANYTTAADANSPVGGYDIVPVLSDPNSKLANYTVASTNGTLTIIAGIASITWANPADIAYGTALSGVQLNAIGSVPGTLVYTPAAGTVLSAGNGQQLSVTLTPTDTNFVGAQTNVMINVLASASAMAVTTSTNQALPGATVTFTATVSAVLPGGGTPTGTVQFSIDGSPSGVPAVLTGGVATLSTSSLAHGLHDVAAAYIGDANFTGSSNSLAGQQSINTLPTAPAYFIVANESTPMSFSAAGLMSGVTDADGDATNLASVSVTSTNGGAVAMEWNMVTFSPVAGSTNADAFTYTVTDNFGGSATGTVSVIIVPAAVAPPTAPVTMLANGHSLLALSAQAGETYIVQGSDDLHTWVNLSRLVAGPDGMVRVEDGDAPAYAHRYYRLVIP